MSYLRVDVWQNCRNKFSNAYQEKTKNIFTLLSFFFRSFHILTQLFIHSQSFLIFPFGIKILQLLQSIYLLEKRKVNKLLKDGSMGIYFIFSNIILKRNLLF